MNVFYLDSNAELIAHWLVDKHIVKMPIESAQMLSSAHRILDGESAPDACYKATHRHHPCTVWTMSSSANYMWHYNLLECMLEEYSRRYNKVHKTSQLLSILSKLPHNIVQNGFTLPPQAIPEIYKQDDVIAAYRIFYRVEKAGFATWKHGDVPAWFV